MVARAVRGLCNIVSSYSLSWTALDAWARSITVPCHVEACGLCPEWLGTVWLPLVHVCPSPEGLFA
jgi:hypothetical protein